VIQATHRGLSKAYDSILNSHIKPGSDPIDGLLADNIESC
jgi:hypothetical protein